MSKKQLIVAADVQAVAKTGVKVIHLHSQNAIVTAEARSVAKELGVELVLDQAAPPAAASPKSPVSPADLDTVRRVIEAQTHAPASDAVMTGSTWLRWLKMNLSLIHISEPTRPY